MAPDEFMLVTALKQRGFVRSIERMEQGVSVSYPPGTLLNSYPTFVVFPAESSPHPVLWTHLERKVMCQVRAGSDAPPMGAWLEEVGFTIYSVRKRYFAACQKGMQQQLVHLTAT